MLALVSIVCAPALASSHTFEFSKPRAELLAENGQFGVERPLLTPETASSYYDPFGEAASGSPLATKGRRLLA